MAYISAVYKQILKIPFYHENYNELWKFLKKKFSRPTPRQGRPGWNRLKWPISQLMAYISAVYKKILKIPFFHENYIKLWKFLKINFFRPTPRLARPGQNRLKWHISQLMAYISAVYKRILKIPFFHENYIKIWKFLKVNFFHPTPRLAGQARPK